jgi:phage shock protein C
VVVKKFYLDKRNAKFMGVCSGIGDYLGVDPTFVRIAMVLVTVAGAFPWTLIAYGVAAWAAKPKVHDGYSEERVAKLSSTKDLHLNMRDIDRRMAEVESFVTNSNSSLANEIEKLR